MQNLVDFARQVIFVHGGKAVSEAAYHAELCERLGDVKTARTWRLVQAAIADLEKPCIH
ncbi:MAG: hypothetical protein JNM20_10155 [Rhizobiales bacterium]|nr:hypothetical protein [Hyphomicrobiales bacterium]